MSKVIKATGYRALSHIVQTNDGSFYMVDSNDTFDHGYETMVFKWDDRKNEVDDWGEVYADWYDSYDQMERKHVAICEGLEIFLETD